MSGVSEAVRAAIVAARAPSQRVARAWRQGDACRALEHALAGLARGTGSGEQGAAVAGVAHRMLATPGWAEALLAPLIDALAADPFFEPPWRATRDPARISAVMIETAELRVVGTLLSADAFAAIPPPATVIASGWRSVTLYHRAGGATLRRWRAESLTPAFSAATAAPAAPLTPLALADGMIVAKDAEEAQLAEAPVRDMVSITINVRAGAAPLMREYSVADGALVRTAASADHASRDEMLLAFLRLAGRADAGPCFEAASRAPAFHLRWAAMREWLRLDARAALPRLAEMATGDANQEVRQAAAQTLATLEHRLSCPG